MAQRPACETDPVNLGLRPDLPAATTATSNAPPRPTGSVPHLYRRHTEAATFEVGHDTIGGPCMATLCLVVIWPQGPARADP